MTLDQDLAVACELADIADELTMARFLATDLTVETKPDMTPVTEADRAVEQALRARLSQVLPGDAVHGEEYGQTGDARDHRRWIIDPIDGTKNYMRGVPVWSTLIALVEGSQVTVGVVCAPALGRRWWAARGQGAWTRDLRGERRISVSRVSALTDASFSYSDDIGWADFAPALPELRETVWRTRAYGDFWSHMLVAEGAVDIAAEPELSLWDIAALIPVIEEAGGKVTSYTGSDALAGPGAVTTNGLLHADVLGILRANREAR